MLVSVRARHVRSASASAVLAARRASCSARRRAPLRAELAPRCASAPRRRPHDGCLPRARAARQPPRPRPRRPPRVRALPGGRARPVRAVRGARRRAAQAAAPNRAVAPGAPVSPPRATQPGLRQRLLPRGGALPAGVGERGGLDARGAPAVAAALHGGPDVWEPGGRAVSAARVDGAPAALAGRALSSFTSHSVTYAHWGRFSGQVQFDTLLPHHLVAIEIINADWTDAETVPALRECLLRHAARSTQQGKALVFHVLQSTTEPTCFKTLEVYSSIDDIRQHLQLLDQQFDDEITPCRAAVNRVRQLYKCIGAL
ncbi:hypothetical protein FGB62_4g435 [Gracilaria domingensis]|nr:hypothetical protein FGB62_4g435 [Gracilaria domingensis]